MDAAMGEPTFKSMSLREFSATDKTAKEIVNSLGIPVKSGATSSDTGMYKFASFSQMVQDPYPSPFLNLSDTKIPSKMFELFGLCRYFYTFDPLVSGAISSLANFPVTDVYMDESQVEDERKSELDDEDPEKKGDSDQLKTYKKAILENVNLNKLLVEIGIDYWLYGNCFIFGEFWKNPDTNEVEWKHVVRLDPTRVIIDHNEATREITYKWRVSERLKQIVTTKKPRNEYDKIPQMVKDAVTNRESLIINPNNIFHFSRPSDSAGDTVWGVPVIANVMKLLMYRNILRQAQEAIAREHIVPFRVYYFDKTNSYDPDADWSGVTSNFAAELNKASKDPNYKVISPVPVNVLNLGGDGRSLLLTPEIEQVQAEILAGMNLPREFIFGGVSWSGSSISLKIVENQFITYRLLLQGFLKFLVKSMAKARKEWESEKDNDKLPGIHMQDLKMQDDSQQKQIVVNLNGAGKVTDQYMWKILGINPDKMMSELEHEMIQKANMNAKVQIETLKSNLDVQKKQLDYQIAFLMYREKTKQDMLNSGDPIKVAVAQQLFGGDMNMQPAVDPNTGIPTDPNAVDPNTGMPAGQDPNQVAMQQGAMQQQMAAAPGAGGQPDQPDQADQPDQQDTTSVDAIIQNLISLPEKDRTRVIKRLPPDMQKQITAKIEEKISDGNYGQGYAKAENLAQQYIKLPPDQQKSQLDMLPAKLRQKVETVMQQLSEGPSKSGPVKKQEPQKPVQPQSPQNPQQMPIDMRPLPEQRPPRRDSQR